MCTTSCMPTIEILLKVLVEVRGGWANVIDPRDQEVLHALRSPYTNSSITTRIIDHSTLSALLICTCEFELSSFEAGNVT